MTSIQFYIPRVVTAAEEYGNSELIVACAQTVIAAYKAIDSQRAKPPRNSPASHVRPSPN